jgi:hypothetical protein
LLLRLNVVGGAKAGLAPCLVAEGFGEPVAELGVLASEPVDALVGACEVGEQGGPADGRAGARRVGRLGGLGGDQRVQVAVSVEQAAVDAGFSELVMIIYLRRAVVPFARGVEDGGDHQVGGVMVEPGEGVAEIYRGSVGEAGREAQDW